MNTLIFVEHSEGKLKKASLEACTYGAKAANGGQVSAVVLGELAADEVARLGNYGVSKVLHDGAAHFNTFDSGAYAKAIAAAAEAEGSELVVTAFNQNGKAVAPRVSVRLGAGHIAGAGTLPNTDGEFTATKVAFSGKGLVNYTIKTDKKVISVAPNSLPVETTGGTATVEAFASGVDASAVKVTVKGTEMQEGDIPLTEAELVVSGGRGLKGPENWGMIEEMAKELGAATACSRAVADLDWRPHHEHVGQTGGTITPNLYIAVAISGAIQHLAGVNNSKTIVVINIDPEAPFFKAADYGIVGDAFEVMPKLIEAYKKFKAA